LAIFEQLLRRGLGTRWALALLLGALLLHTLGPWHWAVLKSADQALYDLRLRALAPALADPRIVIVDIDERSLANHGRWPWRRALLGQLIDDISQWGGARLVALDMVMAEPDRSSGLSTLDALARGSLRDDAAFAHALALLRPSLDEDRQLAATLARSPVVLGFHLSNDPGAARVGQLPPALAALQPLGKAGDALPSWAAHGGNLAMLQDAARLGAGHLNAQLDDDGSVRRLPLVVDVNGQLQGGLALVMARALVAGNTLDPLPALVTTSAQGRLSGLRMTGAAGSLQVPVDERGMSLVPYAAPGAQFVRLPATDVLNHRVPTAALQGKLVLIGVSAPGLIDQHATPVDEAMLGTLVHAHMLSGLINHSVMAEPVQARWIEAMVLCAAGLLLIWALPRLPLWQAFSLTLALMLVQVVGQVAAWQIGGLVLPAASGLLMPPLMLALALLMAYRQATGARKQLAALFEQYVPPELVDRMSLAPERYTMRSRSAELTVLFADVSGFSSLAQHMPPAELGDMMNLLFSHLTDIVREHGGTLDKYIGDAVMAFWGAPLDDPQHARHAVAAALAMRARLPQLHADLAAHGWPPLDLHIGVNTGLMVVGDMGSRHRRAYTVMGDAVNLAARLQAQCSHHGLGLVIGDATRRALGDQRCLALGQVSVRGRDEAVTVWRPMGTSRGQDVAVDQLADAWQHMRETAEAGQTTLAARMLDELALRPEISALCRWQRGRLQSGQMIDIAPVGPQDQPRG
jgi:adenylate cyclase